MGRGGLLAPRRRPVDELRQHPRSCLLSRLRPPVCEETLHVLEFLVHPRFQFSPAADRYDVAVLRLDRPVRYAPHIAPICLPEIGRDPSPGTQAYVAGWGALIPEDVTGPLISILVPEVKRPSVLQVVNVPVICRLHHFILAFA